MTINQRLKIYFDSQNVNVEQTANYIGVSKQAIYNILKGKNDPGASLLEKMCKLLFTLNPTWLMTGMGEMLLSSQPKDERFLEERISDIEKEMKLIMSKIGAEPKWQGMTMKENVKEGSSSKKIVSEKK